MATLSDQVDFQKQVLRQRCTPGSLQRVRGENRRLCSYTEATANPAGGVELRKPLKVIKKQPGRPCPLIQG